MADQLTTSAELTTVTLALTMRDEFVVVGRVLEEHETQMLELTRRVVESEGRSMQLARRVAELEETLLAVRAALTGGSMTQTAVKGDPT